MKATFLNAREDTVRTVFAPQTVQRIAGLSQLDTTVYTKEDLISGKIDLSDVEVLFSTWGIPVLTEEEIRRYLPRLKAVFYAAGSVQHFARPMLKCGVAVFSAWAANAVPVAEFACAQIILANKGYFLLSQTGSQSAYHANRRAFGDYNGNYDSKVGIIGAGMIGKKVIELLRPYKLEILVFDPFLPNETAAALGVKKVDLDELFSQCHVISNHLANNAQTKGMLNGALFEKMRPCATFINTGRGAQVVEADLIRFLQARPDVTALLDVTDPEPPAEDSPLYALPNCLLTPHIAGSSGSEVHRMAEYMADEFEAFLNGTPTRYSVSEKMLETMA